MHPYLQSQTCKMIFVIVFLKKAPKYQYLGIKILEST